MKCLCHFLPGKQGACFLVDLAQGQAVLKAGAVGFVRVLLGKMHLDWLPEIQHSFAPPCGTSKLNLCALQLFNPLFFSSSLLSLCFRSSRRSRPDATPFEQRHGPCRSCRRVWEFYGRRNYPELAEGIVETQASTSPRQRDSKTIDSQFDPCSLEKH